MQARESPDGPGATPSRSGGCLQAWGWHRGWRFLGDEMELMKIETTYGSYHDTMDSREIAERTGKNHADVCRDIRKMLEELELDQSRFASVYKAGNGEDRRCYLLPKRECLILASGYSVKLRAAIIDRWAELEASRPFQPAFQVPRTMSEALRLAADLQDKLDSVQPAIEFVSRYVEAKSTKSISDVAKVLGWKPRAFIDWLIAGNILFRRSGSLIPIQSHIDAGRFEVKTGEEHGHAFIQARFTPEGVEWIAKRMRTQAAKELAA